MQSATRVAEKQRVMGEKGYIDLQQRQEFLTMYISGQLFGIPVMQVQDVLDNQTVTHIPLAPPEIAGSLNLRGRIVTAIDVRVRLNDTVDQEDVDSSMSVVVENGDDLYSLVVDNVGDVLALSQDEYEKNPPNLSPVWKEISGGIYRLDKDLLVVLDVARLLKSVYPSDAPILERE
tara:strand:+ start:4557 stop:5084 length:528 start_codon:yes stop_codon:yes gene_type:complete